MDIQSIFALNFAALRLRNAQQYFSLNINCNLKLLIFDLHLISCPSVRNKDIQFVYVFGLGQVSSLRGIECALTELQSRVQVKVSRESEKEKERESMNIYGRGLHSFLTPAPKINRFSKKQSFILKQHLNWSTLNKVPRLLLQFSMEKLVCNFILWTSQLAHGQRCLC